MRYRSLLAAALGLASFWLAACGNETTTGPTPGEPRPTAPELALTSNSWITRANMPTNRTNLATATVTNSAGQSIVYTIGGKSPAGYPVKAVTAYNVATNVWTFRHALPVPLAGTNGAGVLNGKIYVTGGYSEYGGDFPRRRVFMYNPVTDTWTQKQDMPIIYLDAGDSKQYPMGEGVTGVINGKLYVVSAAFVSNEPWGYQETYNPLFFRYNQATDQWTRLPAPFAGIPTYSPYVGGVIAGKFYVMAQSPYTRDGYFAVYNPATNQWTARTPLGLARPGAATAVLGAKLFVMGGRRYNAATDQFDVLDITIVYDPASDTWTRRAPMPSPRSYIAAIPVLLNGQSRIEVVGGNAPGNNIQYIP